MDREEFKLVKPGDIVIALEDRRALQEGKEYEVISLMEEGGVCYIIVEEGTFFASRFERKNKRKKVICVRPVGKLVNGEEYEVEDCGNDPKDYKTYLNGLFIGVYRKNRFIDIRDVALKDPPPPKEGKESKEVKALFLEMKKFYKGNKKGICSYASIRNGEVFKQFGDICHARLYSHGASDHLLLDISRHIEEMGEAGKLEAYKEYVKWVIKESPWKSCFIEKDIEDIYDTGVELNVSIGHCIGASAALALRIGSEYPTLPTEFVKHREYFSDAVAFILACFLSKEYAKETIGTTDLSGNHHTIEGGASIGDLSNWFKTSVPKNPGTPIKDLKGAGNPVIICESIAKKLPREDEKSLIGYVFKNHKFITERQNWGRPIKSINEHPEFGWMPLGITLTKVLG